MSSSKMAYEGVVSCWLSPVYLLTETFELLLFTFVILDHRCLACVIIQQSSHLMRKMSSILLSTVKAVKNISAICNVPSAAASMNLTGNNMKFTVGQTYKKENLFNFLLPLQNHPSKKYRPPLKVTSAHLAWIPTAACYRISCCFVCSKYVFHIAARIIC